MAQNRIMLSISLDDETNRVAKSISFPCTSEEAQQMWNAVCKAALKEHVRKTKEARSGEVAESRKDT